MRNLLALLFLPVFLGRTHSFVLNVTVNQPGHQISPLLWGIFFEEINHAGDGGLYAELIKNRALSPKLNGGNLDGYSVIKSGDDVDGRMYLSREHPLNSVLTSSLRLNVYSDLNNGQFIGISNSGYYGIPIRPDYTSYRASFYAKTLDSSFLGRLQVSIESSDGSVVFASAEIPQITREFQKYEVILTPNPSLIQTPSVDNIFKIRTVGPVPKNTSIFFNVVSLFPPTYKNRPNGLRTDLVEILYDAKPSFFRFPGGNFLEGNNIPERFIWEETLGDVALRPGHMGNWGYYSTDGLGLLEYLELGEDLGAELILAVFAGYALNGDSVPPQEMSQFIESALNEIEYLIGDNSTTWGARRIQDGRAEPFKLNYVEIGNEDWFSTDYYIRYPQFYDAIREKYPSLEIIATQDVSTRPIPILDDHHYRPYGWFPDNHRFYDNHPRNGPNIFVGEYAMRQTSGNADRPTLAGAIDEAAFMTGFERNGDIVVMACVAPLFGHWEDRDFDPIYFNGVISFATPTWWVQHLFSTIKGDIYLPSGTNANEGREHEKIFHIAMKQSQGNKIILRVVNTNEEDILLDKIELQGVEGTRGGKVVVLTGEQWDENTVEEPNKVAPKEEALNITGNSFSYNAPKFSLSVFEIELQ